MDYPRTFHELLAWFPDESACLCYLERVRWGESFLCPRCGTVGGEWWAVRRGLRKCAACRRETSVTAGTIFHGSRLPLASWFAAIWYVVNQKQGVSALGMQRVLGFGSYQTAWAWLHKLRRAMVEPVMAPRAPADPHTFGLGRAPHLALRLAFPTPRTRRETCNGGWLR